jgi:hypothetical protein
MLLLVSCGQWACMKLFMGRKLFEKSVNWNRLFLLRQVVIPRFVSAGNRLPPPLTTPHHVNTGRYHFLSSSSLHHLISFTAK